MNVIVAPKARRQLRKLPSREQIKILKKFVLLEQNFYAGKKLEGKLGGLMAIRTWPHRILYRAEQHHIYIISVAHRQGAYR